MSKLKSVMQNRTHGHLGDQKKSCFDCIHVLPAFNANEVTCEVYTYKNIRYKVQRIGSMAPEHANICPFFQAMTTEEKTASEQKVRAFYKQLK